MHKLYEKHFIVFLTIRKIYLNNSKKQFCQINEILNIALVIEHI